MRRGAAIFLVLSMGLLGAAIVDVAPQPALAVESAGYVPTTPARVMDTREDLGGPRLQGGRARSLQLGGRGGVPAVGATAVVLNVTVTDPAQEGYVTVWPTGVERPVASNINMVAGATVPNLVTVGLGQGGQVDVFSSVDADLVVDVVGWFRSGFVGVTPGRVMDTREGLGGLVLEPGASRKLQVAGLAGVPTSGATAVALNVTVVEPTSAGYVTVWPGAERPTASNLNFVAGQTVANAVLVGLGSDGSVMLFNSSGNTHLVVDVAGWFSGALTPVVPARLMDTRDGLGGMILGAGETRELVVVGRGGVPVSGVDAVALNVTATVPTAAPYVTVWPAGVDRPTASNLNAVQGATVANAVVVGVGVDGKIAIYNSSGDTHVIVDITGWFASAPPVDSTPPAISDVTFSGITPTSATVTWNTDEPATSSADYGVTAAYGSSTAADQALLASHSRTITGLQPFTTYHVRVKSADADGNEGVSADFTFRTELAPMSFAPAASYAAGGHSHGVAAVNITGSAAIDLVVANALDDTVTVLRGNGNGTFAVPPALTLAVGDEPKSVMSGNLNADSSIDLVTANQGSGDVSVLLGNGFGALAPAVSYAACTGAHEPTLVDLDGDSDLDIAAACWGSSQVRVLANNGNGVFSSAATPTVGADPHSIVGLDVDGDLDKDLAVANHGGDSVTVLRNVGPMSFVATTISVGDAPHSVRSGDLDGDGDADLVTANDGADTVTVLLNSGGGSFSRVDISTGPTPKSVAIADINGDGDLDVLTANITDNYPAVTSPDGDDVTILLGNGDGTFEPPVQLTAPGTPFAVIAADLDGDARLDIVTANWHSGTAVVLLRQ